jgi:DNA polymerase I-like protein with 3'-5' exonuclease and polymerase domains
VDIETDTRWPGRGPKVDYGLSYPAEVTVIALAWSEAGEIVTTALASPFDIPVLEFLKRLFQPPRWIVAHNAVFDLRQLSKLANGFLPQHIWDTQTMARLLHPAVNVSYSLLSVAAMLGIPIPEGQQALKAQRGKLHTLPLEQTLRYAQDDAALALQIYDKQRTLPGDPVLIDWENRAVREYGRMAAVGMRLNIPFVEQRLVELGKQRETLEARLRADGLHAPGSAKARATYLYQTKGIPLPKWDPKSGYFTRAGRRRLS